MRLVDMNDDRRLDVLVITKEEDHLCMYCARGRSQEEYLCSYCGGGGTTAYLIREDWHEAFHDTVHVGDKNSRYYNMYLFLQQPSGHFSSCNCEVIGLGAKYIWSNVVLDSRKVVVYDRGRTWHTWFEYHFDKATGQWRLP